MAYVDKRNRNSKFIKTKQYFIKKRKKPLEIVFDEKAREEFLTGFRKRKLQRKKKAQEDLEVELKAERKRIRLEAKNALKNLVARPDDPDIGEIYADPEIVDMGSHEVHVTELDPERLARENNWIGSNAGKYVLKRDDDDDIKDEPLDDPNEIEGMETTTKRKDSSTKTAKIDLKTSKDVKKFIKKVATKKVQTSKVFQKKRDVEKVRNKKKKVREERSREKLMKKSRRKRNHNRNNHDN